MMSLSSSSSSSSSSSTQQQQQSAPRSIAEALRRDTSHGYNWSEHRPSIVKWPRYHTRCEAYVEYKDCLNQHKPYLLYLEQIESNPNSILLFGVSPAGHTVGIAVSQFFPSVKIRLVEATTHHPLPTKWLEQQDTGAALLHQLQAISVVRRYPKPNKFHRQNSSSSSYEDDDDSECGVEELQLQPLTDCIGFQYNQSQAMYQVSFKDYECLQYFTTQIFPNHTWTIRKQAVEIEAFHTDWKMDEQFSHSSGLRLMNWCAIDADALTTTSLDEIPLTAKDMSIPLWKRFTTDFRGTVPMSHLHAATTTQIPSGFPALRILYYDIEIISEKQLLHDRYFLQNPNEKDDAVGWIPADSTLVNDWIIAINSQLYIFGQAQPVWNFSHCLLKATVKRKEKTVFSFDTEKEMLDHWFQLVFRKLDVDAMEGYNNFVFDTNTVYTRGCSVHQLPLFQEWGRIQGLPQSRWGTRRQHIQSQSKQGMANDFYFITKPGRWEADVLKGVKGNERLNCANSLKLVSEALLKADNMLKDDLDYSDLTKYFLQTDETRGVIVDYNEQDVNCTAAIDLKRGYTKLYLAIGQITNTNMNDMMLHGETLRIYHLFQEYLVKDHWFLNSAPRMEVQKEFHIVSSGKRKRYQYADAAQSMEESDSSMMRWKNSHNMDAQEKPARRKPSKKKNKFEKDMDDRQSDLDHWFVHPSASSSSSVSSSSSSVTVSSSSSSSSSAAEAVSSSSSSSYSDSSATTEEEEDEITHLPFFELWSFLLPAIQAALLPKFKRQRWKPKVHKEHRQKQVFGDGSYEGGFVVQVNQWNRGRHDRPIGCLDFASLYPSILMALLLCLTTYLPNPNNQPEPPIPESERQYITYVHRKIGDRHIAFVQSYKGQPPRTIFPAIESYLIKFRKAVKDQMEQVKETDPALYDSLDTKQKAIKVVMNAIYGALAPEFTQFAMKSIPMNITTFGREHIQLVRYVIEHIGDDRFLWTAPKYNCHLYFQTAFQTLYKETDRFFQLVSWEDLQHSLELLPKQWTRTHEWLTEFWIRLHWSILTTSEQLNKTIKFSAAEKKKYEQLVEQSTLVRQWCLRILFLQDFQFLTHNKYASSSVSSSFFSSSSAAAASSTSSFSSSSTSSSSWSLDDIAHCTKPSVPDYFYTLYSMEGGLSNHLLLIYKHDKKETQQLNNEKSIYGVGRTSLTDVFPPKPSSSCHIWHTDMTLFDHYLVHLLPKEKERREVEREHLRSIQHLVLPLQNIDKTYEQVQLFFKTIQSCFKWWPTVEKADKDLVDQKLMNTRTLLQGRMMLYYATWIGSWEGVYGDTDSLMPRYPSTLFDPDRHPGHDLLQRYDQYNNIWCMGYALQELVNVIFRSPMKMELEKIMWRMLLYNPKMYLYIRRTIYGAVDKVQIQGLYTARRDIAAFSKRILLLALNGLTWPDASTETVLQQVKRSLEPLQHPETLKLEDFVKTVSRKKQYKLQNCYQVHLFRMLKQRYHLTDQDIPVGTRVRFVVCRPPSSQVNLDWKQRLLDVDHFVKENQVAIQAKQPPPHEIDLKHYFDLLDKALHKLLGIQYSKLEVDQMLQPTVTAIAKYQLQNRSMDEFIVRS